MIFIDIEEVEKHIKPGWRDAARAALDELHGADASTRASVLKKHARLWRQVVNALLTVSHGKCWYCENRSDRAPRHIDHYRPKSEVKGCAHPGYWWLAFAVSNFRVCCEFCNQVGTTVTRSTAGGKGTEFPLLVEEDRAHSHEDPLEREQPVLLDPTVPTDCLLLWFDPDAMAQPSPDATTETNVMRTRESIRILNLNEERLRQERFVRMQAFRRAYKRADRLYRRGDQREFQEAFREVAAAAKKENEYHAAVKAALREFNTSEDSLARLILEKL